MQVDVRLYGSLRDRLPREANGRVTLQLPDGTTIADLLAQLGITRAVITAVNDDHETDTRRVLRDGDRVAVFSIMGGGRR